MTEIGRLEKKIADQKIVIDQLTEICQDYQDSQEDGASVPFLRAQVRDRGAEISVLRAFVDGKAILLDNLAEEFKAIANKE